MFPKETFSLVTGLFAGAVGRVSLVQLNPETLVSGLTVVIKHTNQTNYLLVKKKL